MTDFKNPLLKCYMCTVCLSSHRLQYGSGKKPGTVHQKKKRKKKSTSALCQWSLATKLYQEQLLYWWERTKLRHLVRFEREVLFTETSWLALQSSSLSRMEEKLQIQIPRVKLGSQGLEVTLFVTSFSPNNLEKSFIFLDGHFFILLIY